MRRESRLLYTKVVDSLVLSIEQVLQLQARL